MYLGKEVIPPLEQILIPVDSGLSKLITELKLFNRVLDSTVAMLIEQLYPELETAVDVEVFHPEDNVNDEQREGLKSALRGGNLQAIYYIADVRHESLAGQILEYSGNRENLDGYYPNSWEDEKKAICFDLDFLMQTMRAREKEGGI